MHADDTRAWGPPYAKYTGDREGPGESAYYLGVSLDITLKHPELTNPGQQEQALARAIFPAPSWR
jgi:hypothetical protein